MVIMVDMAKPFIVQIKDDKQRRIVVGKDYPLQIHQPIHQP
jgi:hypothetical protein